MVAGGLGKGLRMDQVGGIDYASQHTAGGLKIFQSHHGNISSFII
jgi:hypothetical protein